MTKIYLAGTAVRSVDDPGREGVITNTQPRSLPSGVKYQVKWSDGYQDFVHEDELEELENLDLNDPFSLVTKGRYGRSSDLRRNLTYVHLSGRLANLVYAMGITNTDFYAHQYRPLLTLLNSPANGLLIADEVGLGKTIEAGLIWTELRARYDMRRLLIVCPAMLREKWKEELISRFGVEAEIVNATSLLDALKQPRMQLGEGKAWIISYHSARPTRLWRPDPKTPPKKPSARWLLADHFNANANEEPLLDLVVFDEAHYMRNRETTAWKLGDLLRDVSAHQVMLSATPINLHNRDLFNLLNLIDPDHFASEYDFQRLLESNKPLVSARDAVLNPSKGSAEILEHLKNAANQPLLSHSIQLTSLLNDPPTDEKLASKSYRAELGDTLEQMNMLSHVVTRTRKRDVQQHRSKREVKKEPVEMSDEEKELYYAVTEATRSYAYDRGISDGFLLATPQRQVTSCPAAIAAAWIAGGKSLVELNQDLEEEYEDENEDEDNLLSTSSSLRELLQQTLPRSIDINALRKNDTKLKRLLKVAGEFLSKNPGEKIVVFTTFRATARYLVERLNESGFAAELIWGGQAETKQSVINRFRESKTLRFLISTEVAAEGVDLQFCRVLVNYDLPWNPTRIEQRIGRIDRLGQKSDLIHIWNLYFKETIDDRIVTRLLSRLRVFEEALGESEAIVGETVRKLESALLNRPLTAEEEERSIENAAMALENLRIQREDLEKNAAHMMAHGQRVMERIDAANELSKRVTENDLFTYVRDYLTKHWTEFRFAQEGDDPNLVKIQLPANLAAKFEDFLREEGLLGKTLLSSGQMRNCRFLNRVSEKAKMGEEIINQFHPFIRYISQDLRHRNEHFYPLVAVRANGQKLPDIAAGTYAFYVRCWSFRGVREEEVLASVAIRLENSEVLDEDLSDQVLQLGRVEGTDWLGAVNELKHNKILDSLNIAEDLLDERYRNLLERKKGENADRARFQLDSVEQHLKRRMDKLRETLHAHIAMGRDSLAKATQARIDNENARMNTRRERIQEQQKINSSKNFVCAGVIKIER